MNLEELAGGIDLIERLGEDNWMLRDHVAHLKRRLNESQQVVSEREEIRG